MDNKKKRIDFLLYAHDGRGVGHASRIAAIASALKRINEKYKIICVTGCTEFLSLLPNKSIDWIKMPSYRSTISNGFVRGVFGPSRLNQQDILAIRSSMFIEIVNALDPRCILVDHCPAGKLGELKETLSRYQKGGRCLKVYGLRGIVGAKDSEVYQEILSNEAISYLSNTYDSIMVYTDKNVLDACSIYPQINDTGLPIIHTGYISRAIEFELLGCINNKEEEKDDVVVGMGGGVGSIDLLAKLANIKKSFRPKTERWRIFIGCGVSSKEYDLIVNKFRGIPSVRLTPFSEKYLHHLSHCKAIISYGGYNSIVDAIWTGLPTLLIAKNAPETDQELHLKILSDCGITPWTTHECYLNYLDINRFLDLALSEERINNVKGFTPALYGSETAANYLDSILTQSHIAKV